MGFFDDLGKYATNQAIIEATKKKNGKPDPYAALGAAMGFAMGSGKDFTFGDTMRLGAMLSAQGAFDKDKKKW